MRTLRSTVVKNPFLIGDKVYLRPLEVADARTIVPWFNDPEVTRFLVRYQPISLYAEEEFLRRIPASESDIVVGIVVKETDQLIGTAGLHPEYRCRSARFGITLGDKTTWDHGYGSEATRLLVGYAFATLNLNRVWLHVYEYNPRGQRVYERVGFRTEGRLRQDTYRDGRYWDVIAMGLLRAEWEAARSAHGP
jgi:[ribosomal protein S5]-alanine N-acetyltransferase